MAGFAAIGARAVLSGTDSFFAGLSSIGEAFNALGAGAGVVNDRFAGASAGFNAFNASLRASETVIHGIGGAFGGLVAPIRAVGSAVVNTTEEVVEGSGKMAHALGDVADKAAGIAVVGGGGIAALGASITTLAATAVTESAKYQRGMKDIEGISQTSGPALDELDETIRRVATRFPEAIGQIQKGSLELVKAGIPVQALKGDIVDLAVALQELSTGELTSEQAAEAIGSNLKLFEEDFRRAGDTTEQSARRITAAIAGIANETRASIPEVVTGLTRLGPANEALGGNIEETAALLGTTLGPGLRGDVGGTALRNLIQRLEAPAKPAQKILEARDISLFEAGTGAARPLIDTLLDLGNVYGKDARLASGMSDELAENEIAVIAQTRSGTALRLVLENLAENYQHYLDAVSKTDVLRQTAIQNEALIRQLEILRNNAQLAGIAFGRDFVEGLGSGTKALNDFLSDGQRAQQVAGLLGRTTASVITGKGGDNARAGVADSPFGEEGVKTFDSLFAASEKVRGSLGTLLSDTGTLGQTLKDVAFPDGVDDDITKVAEITSNLIDGLDRLIQKVNELAPEAGRTFREMADSAGPFARSIETIFTENGGEESFDRLGKAGGRAFTVLRTEAGPTITEIAKFLRALEDAAPEIERVAEIGVRAFGAITRGVVGIATSVTSFIDGQLRILLHELDLLGQGRDIVLNFVTRGAEEARHQIIDVSSVAGRKAAEREGLSGGDLGSEQTQAALAAGFNDRSSGRGRLGQLGGLPSGGNADVFGLLNSDVFGTLAGGVANRPLGPSQEEADAFAASEADAAAAARARTTPGHGGDRPDPNAAAKAAALEAATKTLGSAMRTLDKDIADVGGSFDKTIGGAQQRWIDGLEQIALSTEESFRKTDETASEARRKLIESLNVQTEKSGGVQFSLTDENQLQFDLNLEATFVQGHEQIFRRGQEDERRIFDQGIEDRRTARAIGAENDSIAASRANEEETRRETRHQEDISNIRQRGIEDTERIRARGIEDSFTGITRGQERELEAFTRNFDKQNTTRLRAREDLRKDQQLARDLGAATTPAQRTQILASFTEGKRSTDQSRKDQDEDAKIAQEQQDKLTKFRQRQEDDLTKLRRTSDDTEFQHKRELTDADIDYRRNAEIDFTAFRRGLEDRETVRRRIAASLEVASSRADQLEGVGFGRNQQDQAELDKLRNETIPNAERQLREIDVQRDRANVSTAETAARSIIRASDTLQREINAGLATSTEAGRRLMERFENEAATLLERAPGIAPLIDQKRAVLQAQIAVSQGRLGGLAADRTGQVNEITQAQLDQLSAAGVSTSSIRSLFGQDAVANTTSSNLLATPQVDRLTAALQQLTTAIEKIPPGTRIDNLRIENPAGPGEPTIIGTIIGSPVGGAV